MNILETYIEFTKFDCQVRAFLKGTTILSNKKRHFITKKLGRASSQNREQVITLNPFSFMKNSLSCLFFFSLILDTAIRTLGIPGGSVVKNLPANAGEAGSIPGLGRSPRKRNGNSPQYSCLGNPMDRGVWQATVHGVTGSRTGLSNTHIRIIVQTSQAVQWLGLHTSAAGGTGLIPGWGTKISHVTWPKKEKKDC